MVYILLANLKEVLTACEVVKHDDAADFVEQLLFEVLALVEQLLDLLGSLRQHQVLGLFIVVPNFVELFDQSWVLNLPRFVILLFE